MAGLTAVVATTVAVQATEASVSDPKQLARHVNELQREVTALMRRITKLTATTIQGGKPVTNTVGGLAFGNLFKSLSFTAATTQYISHGLGRNYTGYLVTSASSASAITLLIQPLLAGQTADKFIALQSTANATLDIYVF